MINTIKTRNQYEAKTFLISLTVLAIGISVDAQTKDNVKTTFQTSREWKPSIDNRADAVMVYGVGGNPSDKSRKLSFEERVKSWKERGYIIHFMTGIAWGEYQDYFTGQWDGKWHLDEGQVTQTGDTICTVTWCPISYRRRIFKLSERETCEEGNRRRCGCHLHGRA